MVDIEYLEEERKKLWAKIVELSNQMDYLKKTMPEHQKDAMGASKKISEYKNRANAAWSEIETNKEKFTELIKNSEIINTAVTTASDINNLLLQTQQTLKDAEEEQEEVTERIQELDKNAEKLKALQQDGNNTLSNAMSIESKLKALLQNSIETKQKIEDIFDEVEGYDTEDNTHVEGLREKLQNSFEKIEKENQNLKKDFENTKNSLSQWRTTFIKEKETEFNTLSDKIKGLLPGAMSAGLSAAYSEKKKEESIELNNARKLFNMTIVWMSLVALIPIGYYLYLYYKGHPVEYIINHIPQITLVIVPLYAPVIWLATCLNKRINLSKKLIEEYAYKEALNRTYEGLAGQIQNLKDKENELRKEHLHIILKASAENPGKCITGYDKCDNPFLELLSKPEKLSQLIKDQPLFGTFLEQVAKANDANNKKLNEEKNEQK